MGWREVTAGLGTNLWWPVLLGVIVLQNPAPSDASEFCDTEVRVVTPGNPSAVAAMTAPSDAIVLFDGNNSAQWKGRDGDAKWDVHDGVLSVRKGTGDIETKRLFQDMQLHIEWRVPSDITGEEQFRGNSGVLMQGRYEIQVLDSYRNPTYADGQAGAVYRQVAPLVNAMRKPGDWNVYDVIYTAPRFRDDGTVFSPARITVLHNGVLVQNNAEIRGDTFSLGPPTYTAHGKGPIRLQDHPDPSEAISYRNIWVRELGVANAQTDAATEVVRADNHAAPGAFTVDTPVGQLMDNSAARAVLSRCVPALVPNTENAALIRNVTLRYLQPYDGLDDAELRTINDELSRLGATASTRSSPTLFTVDTPLGQVMDNPAARAVLSRRVPALVPDPDIAVLIRKMTLRQLQPIVGGLDDDKLRIINGKLSTIGATPAR